MTVVVFGTAQSVACRHSSGNDTDFLHGVAVLHKTTHYGVTGFVIGGYTLVAFGDYAALLLRSGDDLIDTFEYIHHQYGLTVVTGGKDRRFVEKVGYIRSRKTAGKTGEGFEIHFGGDGFVTGVHLEDGFPSLDVGGVDVNLPVETTGT